MPKTITYVLIAIVIAASTGLLIAQRLRSAPPQDSVRLLQTFQEHPTDECPQPDTLREQLFTCTEQYRDYLIDSTIITLAENTTVTLDGDHLRFDSGRIVVDGEKTLTVRDIAISTSGIVTLVHYSWLNKIDLLVVSGTATVKQGTLTSTITKGNAISIDTLPPYDALSPTEINLDAASVKAFYDWAL